MPARRNNTNRNSLAFHGAPVIADRTQQVPNDLYVAPLSYCVDIEFKCCDCKTVETWTAKQKKWYFEVAKGSLYGPAIRCQACRDKLMPAKDLQREQVRAA